MPGASEGATDAGTPVADGDATAEAGAERPACGPDPYGVACKATAVSMPMAGDFGTDGDATVRVATLANPHATAPGPVTVYLPLKDGKPPVLFFSHAYGATDPASYDLLLRHLASRGYAVVHVPYPSRPPVAAPNADRYACLWEGFQAAIDTYADVIDISRVGFIGHSFGGGATPELARRAFVENAWGSAGRFMFILAPWYSWGTGYETLPLDTRTVVEVYGDDDANDHQIAVEDIWEKLPAGMEKSWLLLRTDDTCGCSLTSSHVLPMTGQTATMNPEAVLNGYDVWGTFRRIDALAAYAFEGDQAAKAVAYGADTAMGSFTGCGGDAVRPLESSATTPITTTCRAPLYRLSARCSNADPGVCP